MEDSPAGNIGDLEKFKNQASSAEMGEAYLGGIKGLGTLHVVRDQVGDVYEVAGTWRLPDDAPEQDLSALKKAHESGEPISYKGQLSDSEKPDKEHIELEVTVSSIQSYTFDATDDSPDT